VRDVAPITAGQIAAYARDVASWARHRLASPISLGRSAPNVVDIHEDLVGDRSQLHELRETVAGARAPWQSNTPVYPRFAGSGVVTNAFESNEAFYASIRAIYNGFSQGRLYVENVVTGKEVERHQLPTVFARATSSATIGVLWERMLQDLYCFGDALLEIVPDQTGQPHSVWRLDPAHTYIEPGEPQKGEPYILRYWVNVGGTYHPIPSSEVLHMQFASPREPGFWGMPPIVAARQMVGIDRELGDLMQLTLMNRAPMTILEAAKGLVMDEAKAKESRSRWARFTGGRTRGDVVVLPDGITARVIGMNWKELDLTAALSIPVSRVAMVHRVPINVLGSLGAGTDPVRAAQEAARLQFWEETILGLQNSVAEHITAKVLPMFRRSNNLRAKFDTSEVKVLQRAADERAKAWANIYSTGLVSQEVAQKRGGIEVHSEGVFATSGAAEEDPPEEEAQLGDDGEQQEEKEGQ
jgi:HK97 family phage portal protein